MANEKQRRAFISYSRTNKEFATKLAKGLRSAGYPIWFDLMDIPTGSRWDDEVEKALRECSVFMIILTPASIASENVKDEIGYAIDHGKRILPVLLENCEVPLRLRRFQYVDFTTKSFEEGFESAKELLGDLIDEASVPAPARTSTVENQMTVKAKYERYAPVKPATEHKDVRESGVGRKKPVSKGLVIIVSVVAVVVLVIAGIGFRALYKIGNNDTPVVKPATETPVVAEPATKAPVVESTNANGYGIGPTMTGNDGMTLLYVPAGEFTMGSDNGEADEKPVHTVYLDAFWIDQTEVTNKQYQACVDAGTCEPPSASSTSNNPSYYGNHFFDNYPVVYVDWDQANRYCEVWAGGDLPTEAQWEKAARGTEAFTYPWGNDAPNKDLLNYKKNIGDTTEVGSYKSGKSPYNAYDMAGNVAEWVNDYYQSDYYTVLGNSASNPQGPTSSRFRVSRGGSWFYADDIVRSAARSGEYPTSASASLGFRCSRSP